MESSSSVYMCFPCYQEFNTLDEVLHHQLTCSAEVTRPEPEPLTPGTTAVSVPLLQTEQQQIIDEPLALARAVLAQQIQTKAEQTTALLNDVVTQDASSELVLSSSDQPRILYQCGDCDELFKSLELWQQHRKEGSCHEPTSETKMKPDPDPYPDPEPNPVCAQEGYPELSPDDTESSEPTPADVKCEVEENTHSQAGAETPEETSPAQSSDPPVVEPLTSDAEDSSPLRKRGSNKKPKPEPVLLCVDCGSSFGLVSELVAHRSNKHGLEEALHRCSVCGECFLNTTLFLYHRKQHRQKGEEKMALEEISTQSNGPEEHAEDAFPTASADVGFTPPESFFCTQCAESFSNKKGLASHRKEKHGLHEALHHCVQCHLDFMNTTQYLYHRRLHRQNPETEIGAESEVEASALPEDTQETKKRLHSATASDPDFPWPKRGRSAIRVSSGNCQHKENDATKGVDSDAANQPPPAKLLQDWARTPLPHVCPYCGKTFTRRVFLRTHVYSHTGEKLFTCKVCSKSFTNSQSLLRHSMSHTGIKPFTCDVCGKNFSQAYTLKRHQQTHISTQPRRKRGRKPVCSLDNNGAAHMFSCPHCVSRFNSEDQLKHHILLHTSHPFPCPECGMAFKRRKELDLHSLTHQDKEPATCPHCSAQFINLAVLDIHLQRCPTSEEERNVGRGRGQGRGRCIGQVECDLCGHRCMTQEGLDLHRLSHTGQTPLKCPVMPCRRRFASNGALEEHVLTHFQGAASKSKHKPRFRCDICHKDFAYTSTFNVHMRTHTDERPFECVTCGKRFRQLPHLQDHERTHSGLRPFSCWVCGKSFSVAARLTEHARTHSGEKPYPCPHCPSAFRSRSNLDKHIRLHGDLPDGEEQAVRDSEEDHAAQVQKVLEGAEMLTSLAAAAAGEPGAVQTIYVLQEGDGGTETVMISTEQLRNIEGASQMVILPSSLIGTQTITVPTISMGGNEITLMGGNASPQHAIEFIVEETV